MLRSEVRFPVKSKPVQLIVFLLGEGFLGFLAIVAVALALLQMWFPLTPAGNTLVNLAQWGIIGWFAVEYLVALAFAPSKSAFLRNPWRVIDLATIIIPLLTLLPGVSNALRSSPVLRLIRLVRVVTLGLRVTGVVTRERSRQARNDESSGPVEVCVVPGHEKSASAASWEEFLEWMKSDSADPKWFSVANVGRKELRTVAEAAGVPAEFLESHLVEATYPHVEMENDYAAVFSWLVESPQRSPAERNGLLTLVSRDGVVTLSRHSTDLTRLIKELRPKPELDRLPFPVRMTGEILRVVLEQNEELSGRFERELGALEELPLHESHPGFFEQTFRLKKELSAAQADLWRLKSVLNDLAEGARKLPGSDGNEKEFLRQLSHDTEYLYDTIVNTREELLSLIDLHLNIVSFDMNRVMRVLAVVSVLGLIPAVVGGLFGMNLVDNPWPFTLKEVSFFVVFGMILCLYFFFVKGWLR
jgi:Mg2+ and Co2+ transporter CorA